MTAGYRNITKISIYKSLEIQENIRTQWDYYYNNGYAAELYDVEFPGPTVIYIRCIICINVCI